MTRVSGTGQPGRRYRAFEAKLGRVYMTVYTLKRVQLKAATMCPQTGELLLSFIYVDDDNKPIGGKAQPDRLDMRERTAARLLMQVD